MQIRKAKKADFEELYAIGLNTPEMSPSAVEPFMDRDDFMLRLSEKYSVFLLAEDNKKIIGFIHANTRGVERPVKDKYVCIVYLVVVPSHRRKGIAGTLYNACIKELKKKGITYVYAWANSKSQVKQFFLKQNFNLGHEYIWMDRKI